MTTGKSMNSSSLIIVMGVSGSGKSHIAHLLAKSLVYNFVEADDFHSHEAKINMANNVPLTDELRQLWLERLCQHLHHNTDKNIVLAFSGLKRKHRNQVRELGFTTQFIWLDGQAELIEQRMNKRKNHFVTAEFLVGQIQAMESPSPLEVDVMKVDINNEIDNIVNQCLDIIGNLHMARGEN
jgi:gluconokinase